MLRKLLTNWLISLLCICTSPHVFLHLPVCIIYIVGWEKSAQTLAIITHPYPSTSLCETKSSVNIEKFTPPQRIYIHSINTLTKLAGFGM